MKYLTSKTAIAIYVLIVLGAVFFAYQAYKKQDAAPTVQQPSQDQGAASNPQTVAQTESTDPALGGSPQNQSSSTSTSAATTPANSSSTATANNTTTSTDDGSSSSSSPTDDTTASPVSTDKNVSGSILANITTDDCNNSCQAFASNLSQLEYCQEVCGISPVKNITSSSTCKKDSGIQQDYCYKDLAITKEDNSYCDDINDANIKQTCQSRIEQDSVESHGNSGA